MTHPFKDLRAFQHDPLQFILQTGTQATGPLAELKLGLRPHYLVTDPELARDILKWPEGEIGKGYLVKRLRPIVGDSSLVISGPEHQRRRAIIHRQLARSNAQQFVPILTSVIRRQIGELIRANQVNISELTGPLAIRLISVVLFGPSALREGDDQAIVRAVHLIEQDVADSMFRMFPQMPWTKHKQLERRQFARSLMSQVVERVSANLQKESTQSALHQLGLDQDSLRDEILTLLLAGHHTTASAAAWIMYHLSREPGLARQISVEAETNSDPSGEIIPERLSNCTISLALVNEVLRLYPSSWWYSRETKNQLDLCGKTLPAGASLIISPWLFHRSDRFWAQPDRFDLTRHFGQKAFMPFGHGPRACVGMGIAILELQLMALELASSCRLDLVDPDMVYAPRPSLTLVPPPMNMRISPTSHQEADYKAA
jgi:cytochrome P450